MADNDSEPLNVNRTGISMGGYNRRQCGCLWLLYTIGGLAGLVGFVVSVFVSDVYVDTNIIYCIILICWGLATIWVQIEDKDDHLLITYGPCRWMLCGMGKEKIPYNLIRDFELTQTCFYGFGLNCNTVKLFNTCSCCCGEMGKCCGHKVVRITISERAQGHGAADDTDCCLERCCLNCCCGENGRYIGKGCWCQPCCNPCNANCCMMNTIFVSTNDAEGLMQLLTEKTATREETHHIMI